VDRRIGKEPKYQSKTPRYCLPMFGPQRKHRVWLVLDGDTLYVDKNGNGDLTEKGKRIKIPAFNLSDYPAWVWERKIEVGNLSVGGLSHTGLVVSQWQYRRKAVLPNDNIPSALTPQEWQEHIDRVWRQVPDGVVAGVSLDLDTRCYGLFRDTKGQRVKVSARIDRNGVLAFADRPQHAPVVYFGGPLTLDLRPGEKLRRGEEPAETLTGTETAFWLGTPGLGPGTFALMAHDLVPREVHPIAEIRFPARKPGQKEVTRKYVLQSWPGHVFLGPVSVPDEAGPGMAKVTLTFADWKEGRVMPATAVLPVLDAEPRKNTKP
ncbi:MAG TPA: hypothetical protein VKD71_10030, partial [Gemmataceae bacterium]|nr:hypothetical protein [Gemmataceae bacterium]